jgi:hypothetical protein
MDFPPMMGTGLQGRRPNGMVFERKLRRTTWLSINSPGFGKDMPKIKAIVG